MQKAKDFRGERDEELDAKLEVLRKEVYAIRSQKLEAKTQKTHLIGGMRKEIARILTVKNERKKK